MRAFIFGAVSALLLSTGVVLLWQGRAAPSDVPVAPEARPAVAGPGLTLARIPDAPEADPKSKEEKRFDRADKNKDGAITLAELIEPRRKPFAKLDLNRDGVLSFEEWAVKTITKFKTADGDSSTKLTRAEYATTAPKPKPKKAACACGPSLASAED